MSKSLGFMRKGFRFRGASGCNSVMLGAQEDAAKLFSRCRIPSISVRISSMFSWFDVVMPVSMPISFDSLKMFETSVMMSFWCWRWRSGTFWFFDSFCDAILMLQVVVRNSLILLQLLWRCFDAGCCRGDIRDDGYRNRITLDLKIHWQWRFRHCQCLLEAAAEEMELLHQAADGVHMWGHM